MKMFDRSEAPFSYLQAAIVVVLYFIVYFGFGSDIFTAITLFFHGNYTMFMWIQLLFYALMTAGILALLSPILTESQINYARHRKECWIIALTTILKMYFWMIVLNLILNSFTGQATSDNQAEINGALKNIPLVTILLSTVFAPICEEMVFRGCIYRKLRDNGYWLATIFTSLAFGFVHVSSAFVSGNYKDLLYLITYSALGYFLCDAYEKSGSVYTTISMHLLINLVSVILNILSMRGLL